MTALIRPFLDLLLFRGKVEHLPASNTLLTITILAALIGDTIGSTNHTGLITASLLSIAQILALAALFWVIFSLHRKPERWLQSVIAIFGVLAILNIVSMPFSAALELDPGAPLQITFPLLAVGILQIWFFVVQVRILREALEIGTGRAVLIAFLMSYVIAITVASLFGMTTGGPAGG